MKKINEYNENGIKMLISNHKCEFIDRELCHFNKETIIVKRRIHSKNPESIVNEYLLWN
jgi:hypothetical protein